MSPATVATRESPHTIAVSADAARICASDNGSNAVSRYARDLETGKLTALSPARLRQGYRPYGIAVSPDGRSAYVANEESKSISQYSR
jgi:DNA-binding beta-propeller fold protein YncE